MLAEDVYAHVGGRMELRAADTTRQARASPTHVGERRHGTPRGWGGWRVEEGGNDSTRTPCKAHHKQRSATKRQPQHHHPVVHVREDSGMGGRGRGEQGVATKYTARAPHQGVSSWW